MACRGDGLGDQKCQVIILRAAKGPEDPYLTALTNAGLGPVSFIPVLQYDFINSEELVTDLLDSDKFSGVVFTSQTAVEASSHALSLSSTAWKEKLAEQWKDSPVFVVGKATSQAVAELGVQATTGSFSGNAEALSKVIADYFSDQGQRLPPIKPLLFPCGNLRKENLPRAMEEAGIALKSVICYKTIPHTEIAQTLKTAQLSDTRVWVVFFSPSGVTFALEHVKERLASGHFKVAAIGPSTADSINKAGIHPDVVAKQPTPESLVEGILTQIKN